MVVKILNLDRKWLGPVGVLGFLLVIFVQESRIRWYRERLTKSNPFEPELFSLHNGDLEPGAGHVTNLQISTFQTQISPGLAKSNSAALQRESCPIKDNTDWSKNVESKYR